MVSEQIYKGISNLLSILFHPLFINIYVLFLFLAINPYMFPYRNNKEFGALIITIISLMIVMPGVAILMMRATGLVKSLNLTERTERIGPLMVTAVAYLWVFLNIRTHTAFPGIFSAFILGALISVCIGFFFNNFHKISLHSIGMGGFLVAIGNVIVSNGRSFSSFKLFNNYDLTVHNLFLLAFIILIAGAVISSRLYLKAHTIKDVFGGLLVGIIGQLIALRVF